MCARFVPCVEKRFGYNRVESHLVDCGGSAHPQDCHHPSLYGYPEQKMILQLLRAHFLTTWSAQLCRIKCLAFLHASYYVTLISRFIHVYMYTCVQRYQPGTVISSWNPPNFSTPEYRNWTTPLRVCPPLWFACRQTFMKVLPDVYLTCGSKMFYADTGQCATDGSPCPLYHCPCA